MPDIYAGAVFGDIISPVTPKRPEDKKDRNKQAHFSPVPEAARSAGDIIEDISREDNYSRRR